MRGVAKTGEGFVKIRFKLVVDEEGWPPVVSEGLWAEPMGDGRYRIDNTPWFVPNLAADDIVMADDRDGKLWATGRVQWSGRLTLRVIPFPEGPLRGDRRAVLDSFAPLGVTGEGVEQYGIVALDVPADADLHAIKTLLLAGGADGRWDYEEGCVSDRWIDLLVSVPSVPHAAPASPVDEPVAKAEHHQRRRERALQIYGERVAEQDRQHPGYQAAWLALRQVILQHSGEEVVPPRSPELLLEMLVQDGALTAAESVVKMPGLKSDCHNNAVALWRRGDAVAVGTGYALSDDGLWREHSWAWDDQGRIIETTESRSRYFGLRFDADGAEWFANWISPEE